MEIRPQLRCRHVMHVVKLVDLKIMELMLFPAPS